MTFLQHDIKSEPHSYIWGKLVCSSHPGSSAGPVLSLMLALRSLDGKLHNTLLWTKHSPSHMKLTRNLGCSAKFEWGNRGEGGGGGHRVTPNFLISIPILVLKLLGRVKSLGSLSCSFSCCWAIFVTWQSAVNHRGGWCHWNMSILWEERGMWLNHNQDSANGLRRGAQKKDFWRDYISVVRL